MFAPEPGSGRWEQSSPKLSLFTRKSSQWGVQCLYWYVWFFFFLTCAASVSRSWEFVCFWRAGEEKSRRLSDTAAVRASLSTSLPRLQMPVFTFFFSLKFSFSSLCISNTVLASCNKIDLGQRKNPWRCGAVISGASGDGCSGADVVRARPPPTTAPHYWWFW